MKHWKKYLEIAGATVAVLFSTGCAGFFPPVTDPTRFYVLDVLEYETVTEETPEREAVVGLARIRVARYLEDAGMTVREQGTRVIYSQQHRWAESIEHGVGRLLTENLGAEPVVARVESQAAQRRTLPDFDLYVSVTRAEGVRLPGGAYGDFRADWELRAGIDSEIVARGQIRAERLPWDGQDFAQLTKSLSQGVVELTHDVARALEEL